MQIAQLAPSPDMAEMLSALKLGIWPVWMAWRAIIRLKVSGFRIGPTSMGPERVSLIRYASFQPPCETYNDRRANSDFCARKGGLLDGLQASGDGARMPNELDVLRIVTERLGRLEIVFMLTGALAMAYYATPRMTRDLNLVVALQEADVGKLLGEFASDFYVDADAARDAVRSGRLFNMMHLESGIKLDMIIKKSTPYRDLEFSRRASGVLGGVATWLVSREDLILSKLIWARDSGSELQ